ncbi:putative repeated motif containing protein [Lyophyllum shimeji]|uniref:Repeated motif containing protein n=1 Tax=Lyophyllum shimeji TaxID=47721 RepID=A0A9P3UKZ6_LYOSH|nr:putative repeated motif containing protein [Lyophyllum shimeji]
MLSTLTASELLGYASIGCWLGAQLPQVVENIRRQSCEGLALPFLANWLLGDVSNLVGCILTHQLPFQTYLATYFVFVDCTLVAQYFYYSSRTKPVPSFGTRPLPSAPRARRISVERGAARYRTLSAVAANVAASAALAAQQDEQADHRRRWQVRSTDRFNDMSRVASSQDMAEGDDVDEDALAALSDSFHSEAGHESRRERLSWSIERYRRRSGSLGMMPSFIPAPLTSAPLPIQSTDSLLDAAGRGRPLQRNLDDGIEIQPEMTNTRRSSRVRPPTMVFLSVWALFGIGTLAGARRGFITTPGSSMGQVLSVRSLGMAESAAFHHLSSRAATNPRDIRLFDERTSYADTPIYDSAFMMTDPLSERVIGRMFAWLCTTLYLTSRLPQIWKNYVRKSVEGLSMYLFVFAFLGNVFYVASILSSPNMRLPAPESTTFIKESIPYLLGSAGTLIFDITIVAQSFVYRPRHRRHSTLYNSRVEEEAGLLTGESIARHASDSTVVPRGRSSRTRTSV